LAHSALRRNHHPVGERKKGQVAVAGGIGCGGESQKKMEDYVGEKAENDEKLE